MLEHPQTGLIGRFYRQVENRPKKRGTTRRYVCIPWYYFAKHNLFTYNGGKQ